MIIKDRSKMKKEIISTKSAPVPVGPYSQAVKVGEFIYVSGQVSMDSSTGKLVGASIEDQTRQCLENIKAILEVAGSSIDSVVKVSVFIKDMDEFQEMNKIYGQYFTKNFPARSCVQVAKLPLDVKVEIEVIALQLN